MQQGTCQRSERLQAHLQRLSPASAHRRSQAAAALERWACWHSHKTLATRDRARSQVSASHAEQVQLATRPTEASPLAASAASAPAAGSSGRADAADRSSALSLDNIRQSLIRQEDTIIFSLIERAQFARNDPVYQSGAIEVPGYTPEGRRYSLLEYLLRETEAVHGRIRRYTSPDEQAFFPGDLPPLVLPPITYPTVLASHSADINLNDRILRMYCDQLLPGITDPGDDNNYGSAAMYDVLALQALSKRIHYGNFVAEAKFRANRETYSQLIRARDAEGLMALLTDRAVEEKVVERVRRKAAIYGQDLDHEGATSSAVAAGASSTGDGKPPPQRWQDGTHPAGQEVHFRVSPDTVAQLYDRWVMPLTKEVQVAYLLGRLDHTEPDL